MSLQVDIRKTFGTKNKESFTLEAAFEVGQETLGFLGASGCGKSLTLRCIAGVETPDEGRIVVNNRVFYDSAAGVNLTPQQRKTALLFQNYQLFPNLTVKQNILAGVFLKDDQGATRGTGRKAYKDAGKAILATQLKRFELESLENRYPISLSGGQQQRVALARMLAAQPEILMLDEPFSALDSHLKSALEQNLLDLFEQYEGSILYVSHDIDEAFRFCDRIAVVDDGSISEIGTTEQIVQSPSTLASIKLSGCKNTSEARKIGERELYAVNWGIRLKTSQRVPDDIKYVGIRAFNIKRAQGNECNVTRCEVIRVSDSRFESTALVRKLGCETNDARIQWKIDKLSNVQEKLPAKGEIVNLVFQSEKLYLATR